MFEGDDEDLWFRCLDTAFDMVPKNHTNRAHRARVLADTLYDACKDKTAKSQAARPKLVTQIKS
jgi:hypothetical protein